MTEMFPIVPLGPGQAVSIALSSYDGGVFYGINGDRDAMPDADLLADADRGVARRARGRHRTSGRAVAPRSAGTGDRGAPHRWRTT